MLKKINNNTFEETKTIKVQYFLDELYRQQENFERELVEIKKRLQEVKDRIAQINKLK